MDLCHFWWVIFLINFILNNLIRLLNDFYIKYLACKYHQGISKEQNISLAFWVFAILQLNHMRIVVMFGLHYKPQRHQNIDPNNTSELANSQNEFYMRLCWYNDFESNEIGHIGIWYCHRIHMFHIDSMG